MRFSLGLTVALLGWGATSYAQQPIDPYSGGPAVAQPAPAPIDPNSGYPPPPPPYPPPPAYGYQPPAAGAAQPQYPSPQYQQGYYLYPTPGGPPVYYAPPPGGQYVLVRPVRRWDGVRRWSLGAHLNVLGVGQQIGNHNMTLGGGGFQFRVRSRGRVGFEMSQSFLHASYWNGGFVRDSYPFQLSFMTYLFPNEDRRHFNLYGLVGAGLMSDSVQLYDENRVKVTQDFLEWILHAGLGAELRWKWFAIEAEVRALGLFLDPSAGQAPYYRGITTGPVPDQTWGVEGRASLSFWF
jgi:hypothetical protein